MENLFHGFLQESLSLWWMFKQFSFNIKTYCTDYWKYIEIIFLFPIHPFNFVISSHFSHPIQPFLDICLTFPPFNSTIFRHLSFISPFQFNDFYTFSLHFPLSIQPFLHIFLTFPPFNSTIFTHFPYISPFQFNHF